MKNSLLARITKNSVVGLLEKIIEISAGIATIALLARYLDVEMFGLYTLIVTFAGMMLTLCSVGLDRIMVRDIAADRENLLVYIRSIKGARMILAGISLLVIIVIAVPMGIESRLAMTSLLIFAASEVMSMYTNIYMSVFKAFEKMEYNTFITGATKMLTLSGVVFVVYSDMGFLGIFLSIAAGAIGKAILTIRLFKKNFSRAIIPISFAHSRKIVADSLTVAASTFFTLASIRMGVFLLQAFGTLTDVAYFQAANVLLIQLQPAAIVIVMALYPAMASLKDEGKLLFEKAATFIFIISLPLMAFIFFWGDQLIVLVYGYKYLNAVPAMKILILSLAFTFLIHILEIALLLEYKQKLLTFGWGTAFFSNIILGVAIVPEYGLSGCAAVMSASYIILFFILSYMVHKYTIFPISVGIFIKPVPAFFLMGLYLYFFFDVHEPDKNISRIINFIVSLMIYFLALFLSKAFSISDLKKQQRVEQ